MHKGYRDLLSFSYAKKISRREEVLDVPEPISTILDCTIDGERGNLFFHRSNPPIRLSEHSGGIIGIPQIPDLP
jgi:hypothetical protein